MVILCLPDSRSNWNLEMLVFEERRKPEYPDKNLSDRSKGENQQQTQPTNGVDNGIRIWATQVGGECSHHKATPFPQRERCRTNYLYQLIWLKENLPP